MEKQIYLALTVCENGKYYSWAMRTGSNNNLLSVLAIKNLISANVCDTFKRAKEIVSAWNETYRINGTYLFEDAFCETA